MNDHLHPPLAGSLCRFEQLLITPALKVGDFVCPGTPPITEVEAAPFPELVLVRKGAYIRRDCAGSVYIDRTVAAFFEADRPYVIEHPRPRPDATTVISLVQPESICSSLGVEGVGGTCFARSAIRASPEHHLLHRRLLAELRSGPQQALAAEETAVTLVVTVVAANHAVELASPPTARLAPGEVDVAVAIAEYLNAHFRSPINLAILAAHTGYSVFHICRIFQARMKSTIHKYLLTLRLEAAMEQLAESDMPVLTLALELGFNSHSHFTTTFTRWAGMTPRQARQSSRSRSIG